jgi:predicted ATPase
LERFGKWLFAETEGQPFHLIETLKVLLERGVLASHPNEGGGWTIDFKAAIENETVVRGFFPPSVREVICTRLDRLTSNAFALLIAGTILGEGITFERLCQVADLEERDGLPALDEVLRSGLLYESDHEGEEKDGMTHGRYVFAHPKIRTVVYAEAGEARRSIFHRRALQSLQATAAPATKLAYHALAAGLAEPAFHWSLVAGDEAMRVAAIRDAISLYEQARHLMTERLDGIDLESTLSGSKIEHLYTHLGRAYELNAEWEKARAIYTLLLTYARDSGQPVMESNTLNHLATLAAQ